MTADPAGQILGHLDALQRYVGIMSTQIRRAADALPPTPDAPSDDAAATGDDACRPVEVDGETIRVRGAGDLTEQAQGYVADIVRAAQRKYAAEHPAATSVPCSPGVLRRPHPAHDWEPQPGMTPVHCPGTPNPTTED